MSGARRLRLLVPFHGVRNSEPVLQAGPDKLGAVPAPVCGPAVRAGPDELAAALAPAWALGRRTGPEELVAVSALVPNLNLELNGLRSSGGPSPKINVMVFVFSVVASK